MQIAQKPHRTRGIRRKLLGLALLPATLLAGCQTGEGTGALVGAGAGGLAGNVIAKATHGSRTAGTLIGGVAGGILGAAAGSAHDKSVADAQARGAAQAQAAVQAQQGDIMEIARLARQGVSEAVMINQVRTSGRIYTLSANDIIYLKDNTVPETVIAEMQATANRPPRVVYQEVPVARPVYVAEPAPAVGFGLSYTNIRR
ncbi:MAG: hypothetical protein HYS12_07610 [Planctomycetes bacterium]|nr:hypothetical protein [Planctomycetota bacterium]